MKYGPAADSLKVCLRLIRGAAETADPEVALELAGAAGVGGVPPLGALVAAGRRAGELEGQAVDLSAASLLDGVGRRDGGPAAGFHLGDGVRQGHER
ncbi:hypothetical protein ACRJ4W_36500 [Streptomyces sp. GLT-R25]